MFTSVSRRCILIVCVAAACFAFMSAASAAEEASAISGAFVEETPGGRGAALGGGLSAIVDDPSAIYWNPARLLYVAQPGAMATYADLFGLGLARQIDLFIAYPRREQIICWERGRVACEPGAVVTAYGFGLRSTSVDLDPESYTEYDVSLGLARRGWLGLAYGAVGHLLLARSDIENVGATGFAFDLALERAACRSISASIVLRSLFSTLSWDEGREELSPSAVIGIGVKPTSNVAIPIAATYDLDRAALIQLSGGIEWLPVGETLALRAGLRWRDDGADAEINPAGGVGLRWQQVAFDYGLAAGREELGDTHRLSLQVSF